MGVDGSSKENNAGNLVRSAHSFGASFFFFIKPAIDLNCRCHLHHRLSPILALQKKSTRGGGRRQEP